MPRIAVIGAGPSGLSTLISFRQAEIEGMQIPEIVCYDKQEDWGGLWNFSWRTGTDLYGDTVHNGMYQHLWSNGPKECLEFGNYTFDEHLGKPIPSFPPRPILYDYLTGRAAKYDVKKYIKLNTRVEQVTYENEKFYVTVWNKPEKHVSTEEFDFVVVATGHFSVPFIPEYPGMESFPGRILHSHDFRNAEEFSGQDLLVLGSSYSAEDISLQCYKYGANSVSIGYRNKPMGFKWPPTVKEFFYLDRLEGSTAYFRDGHNQKVDAIILCTGYLHYFPFLEDKLKLKTTNRMNCSDLYKGVVWQNNPRLFYLGMQDQFYTFSMFDAQAWYVRDVILDKIILPSESEIQKDIEKWNLKEEKITNAFDQIDFQTDYIKDLFEEVDCPKFNLDVASQHFKVWEHHKDENILTYRDKSFTSPVTGTASSIPHIGWLHAMDDSAKSFLENS